MCRFQAIFAITRASPPEVEDYEDASYSYQRFRGPVSGEIHKVTVPGYYENQHQTEDFVAKPDYNYAYGVQDPKNMNHQNHQESRNGDMVKGEYRVLQADGIVRIVRYTAGGPSGFQATVTYEKP